MADYRNSKWAKELLALQREDGSWGYFHSLSEPGKSSPTTEQALRRLAVLGYRMQDEPIQRCVAYMHECLRGIRQTPDRREKLHDWDIFTRLMLATWIRRFTDEIAAANSVAATWAGIISAAFVSGQYRHSDYVAAYADAFGEAPRGGRLVDFVSFYQVSLISPCLDRAIEPLVFQHILSHPEGIYYIYGRPLSEPPPSFQSKLASRYLAAAELLAAYPSAKGRLGFVVAWLQANRNASGRWDMGSAAKDGIYFPLSDSWRQPAAREADCTYRIERLLQRISR
ncbi:MAG: hypothetical protein ACOX2K_10400 [Bacillota bacterium]|jgi:hypothetical protein